MWGFGASPTAIVVIVITVASTDHSRAAAVEERLEERTHTARGVTSCVGALRDVHAEMLARRTTQTSRRDGVLSRTSWRPENPAWYRSSHKESNHRREDLT